MAKTKRILNAIGRAEGFSDEQSVLVEEMKELQGLKKMLNDKYISESNKLIKRKIGVQINDVNFCINACRKKIEEGRKYDLNEMGKAYMNVASAVLPYRVHDKITKYAIERLENRSYPVEIMEMLSVEQMENLEKSAKYKIENEAIKKKILSAKKIINEVMPNFLGELSADEFDSRTKLTRILTKILREL